MKLQLTCANGPYNLDIRYRGNKILSATSHFGYCERNILKTIKGFSALKCLPFVERIDPYSSQHYSICFCSAVEKALNHKEDQKLSAIRTTFLELERALSHICHIKAMMGLADNIILYNLIDSAKDTVIDTIEDITGRRLYPTAHYFTGLNFNLSHGNIKSIETTCTKIRQDLKEFRELFFGNPSIKSLLEDEAIINQQTAANMTGPFSWINAEVKDLRIKEPYLCYKDDAVKDLLTKKFRSNTNCIYFRILAILDDTTTSLNIIKTVISKFDLLYSNSERLIDKFYTKPGEYASSIETPRGLLNMTIVIDANSTVEKLTIKSPTEINDLAVSKTLNGCEIEQAGLAFESLYLSPMEADK